MTECPYCADDECQHPNLTTELAAMKETALTHFDKSIESHLNYLAACDEISTVRAGLEEALEEISDLRSENRDFWKCLGCSRVVMVKGVFEEGESFHREYFHEDDETPACNPRAEELQIALEEARGRIEAAKGYLTLPANREADNHNRAMLGIKSSLIDNLLSILGWEAP